jgi:hypothetical protein
MNPLHAFALILIGLGAGALGAPLTEPETCFDPGAVETVSGEVVHVGKIAPGLARTQSMHLVLETDAGQRIAVELGPEWAVERGAIRISAGDRIEVTGWQIVRGKPPLVAAEVNKAGEILLLRDRHGVPVWTLR